MKPEIIKLEQGRSYSLIDLQRHLHAGGIIGVDVE